MIFLWRKKIETHVYFRSGVNKFAMTEDLTICIDEEDVRVDLLIIVGYILNNILHM